MKKINSLFSIKKGVITDWNSDYDFAVEIPCEVDSDYSYVLYKNTAFLAYEEDLISNNGIKVYSDEYAYICFYDEGVPNHLRNDFIGLLEKMVALKGIKFAFTVCDSKSGFSQYDHLLFDRGYKEFSGINSDILAEKLGAYLIYDCTYRKRVI